MQTKEKHDEINENSTNIRQNETKKKEKRRENKWRGNQFTKEGRGGGDVEKWSRGGREWGKLKEQKGTGMGEKWWSAVEGKENEGN